MKKAGTGLNTSLAELSRLAFASATISNAERQRRRQNAAARAAVQRNSAARAAARRQSPPRPKARTPSPPRRRNSPPKNKGRSASPRRNRVTVGARVPISSRVVVKPNGTKELQFFITNEYYRVGPNGKYNFTKPMRR